MRLNMISSMSHGETEEVRVQRELNRYVTPVLEEMVYFFMDSSITTLIL